MLDPALSTLLLLDFQSRLMPAMVNAEAVIQNAARLAKAATMLQIPIRATVQNPDKLGGFVEPLGPFAGAPRQKCISMPREPMVSTPASLRNW